MGEFLVGAAQNQYFDSVSPLPTLAVLACEPGDYSGEKKKQSGEYSVITQQSPLQN